MMSDAETPTPGEDVDPPYEAEVRKRIATFRDTYFHYSHDAVARQQLDVLADDIVRIVRRYIPGGET